jgi:archaellum component FlaC
MPTVAEVEVPVSPGQFSESLERIWNEIKEISHQVEQETRRSGRFARLRLDSRQLRRQLIEVQARLGKAVFEAFVSKGGEIRLEEIEGIGDQIAALDRLQEQVAAKENEIDDLQAPAPSAEALVETV